MLLLCERGKCRTAPVITLWCNLQIASYSSEQGNKIFIPICKRKHKERREIFYIYQREIKKGFVPRDMLVWSVMTLGADLLRQIATDPRGFPRAHSIGNGLFNSHREPCHFLALHHLKRRPLLGSVSQRKIFTESCFNSARTLFDYSLIYLLYYQSRPRNYLCVCVCSVCVCIYIQRSTQNWGWVMVTNAHFRMF